MSKLIVQMQYSIDGFVGGPRLTKMSTTSTPYPMIPENVAIAFGSSPWP
jgi:hypothetical protein